MASRQRMAKDFVETLSLSTDVATLHSTFSSISGLELPQLVEFLDLGGVLHLARHFNEENALQLPELFEEILKLLDCLPLKVKHLNESGLGKIVKKLIRNKQLAAKYPKLKDIFRNWKRIVELEAKGIQGDIPTSKASGDGQSSRNEINARPSSQKLTDSTQEVKEKKLSAESTPTPTSNAPQKQENVKKESSEPKVVMVANNDFMKLIEQSKKGTRRKVLPSPATSSSSSSRSSSSSSSSSSSVSSTPPAPSSTSSSSSSSSSSISNSEQIHSAHLHPSSAKSTQRSVVVLETLPEDENGGKESVIDTSHKRKRDDADDPKEIENVEPPKKKKKVSWAAEINNIRFIPREMSATRRVRKVHFEQFFGFRAFILNR